MLSCLQAKLSWTYAYLGRGCFSETGRKPTFHEQIFNDYFPYNELYSENNYRCETLKEISLFPIFINYFPLLSTKMADVTENSRFEEHKQFLMHNFDLIHNTHCRLFTHSSPSSKYIQTTVLMPLAARKTRIYVHKLSYIVYSQLTTTDKVHTRNTARDMANTLIAYVMLI